MTLYEITETYTAGIQPQQHIVYPSPQHINQPAINLLAALKGELTNIPGANDHILHDGIGQKTSIVINIPGYRPYKEPRNVTCVQDGVKVQKPQSGVMGETARATQSFIDKADTLRVLEGPGGILFGPGHLELKDLWLLRLVRVSKGAYQAVLGIQVDDEAQLDLGVPPAPAPTPAAGFPDDTPAYAPADSALVEHVWDSLVQNVIATEASHPNAYATLPLQLAAFLDGGEDAAGYLANYNYPGPYQFLADHWKGWSGNLHH